MAKYTLEDIMCGEKYNIESDVFMEVFRLVEQKTDAKLIREQLNTIYVKHALMTAKRMIEETTLNFTQISEHLGFHTIGYFSRLFKEKTGMTPSEYARAIKNKP